MMEQDQFYVLFNFNAQVGDEWANRTYEPYADNEAVIHVDNISSTIINGETLKVYYISSDMHGLSFGYENGSSIGKGRIIEKLGGFWYMFPQNYALWDGEIRKGLRCYSDSQFGNYKSGVSADCEEIITSLINKESSRIKISPNPSAGEIRISANSNKIQKVIIYSSFGNISEVQDAEFPDEEIQIKIPEPGIYYLLLKTTKEEFFSEKVVVQ